MTLCCILAALKRNWGVAKWLRQRVLIPPSVGSNPTTPAIFEPPETQGVTRGPTDVVLR